MTVANPTITFVDGERRVSDPIPVPLWSNVTLLGQPGQPTIYMGCNKLVLYSGPYQVDGKQFEAPAMKVPPWGGQPAGTRVMPRVIPEPVQRPVRRRRYGPVVMPAWALVLLGVAFFAMYGALLWLAIPSW